MIPGTLELWQWISSPDGQPLMDAAASVHSGDVQEISRLRKTWSRDQVAVALELTQARRRAADKYPDMHELVCDLAGVEQATPALIAQHKAARICTALSTSTHVIDLGCGIGGDTMALAQSLPVTGVDLDPIRCWMTSINAGCITINEDLRTCSRDADVFHLDPGRRDPQTGRRLRDPEQWLPPLSTITHIGDRYSGGIVKLGPGINTRDLSIINEHELEFVSLKGSLSQAQLWMGSLAPEPGLHRATRLPEGLSVVGEPCEPDPKLEGSFSTYLCVPDPALERSGLHGMVGREWKLQEPAAGLGLLTGSSVPSTDWFTTFQIEEEMAWRPDRIAAWLKAHDGGHVDLKTRDGTVDPDQYQVMLSGSGEINRTVFVLRMGRPVVAIITQRVENPRPLPPPTGSEDGYPALA